MPPVQPQPPKKNKNGLIIGIAAGAVALIAIVAVVLIVVLGGKDKDNNSDADAKKPSVSQEEVQKPTKNPSEKPTEPKTDSSYEEIALAFMKELSDLDFDGADKYSILNTSDIFEIYANKNGIELSEIYSSVSEAFYEEFGKNVQINSASDLNSCIREEVKEEFTEDELLSIKQDMRNVKISSSEKLDLYDSNDRDALIDDIISCDWFDLINYSDYTDYINLDDITEAYRVNFDNGSWFFVAKYKGEWRVVMNAVQSFVDM